LFVTELHEGKVYLLNSHSIDRDGTYEGYDIDLKKFISKYDEFVLDTETTSLNIIEAELV